MRIRKVSSPRPEEARFESHNAKLRPDRAVLSCKDLGIYIQFQFNPVQLDESKSLSWNKEPIYGLNEPLISFSCGEARELKLQAVIDSHFSDFDVGELLDKLDDLTIPYNINGRRTTGVPAFGIAKSSVPPIWGIPPVCKLAYGGKVRTVILVSKDVQEVMHGTTEPTKFSRKPTRAIVNLQFLVIENMRSLVDLKSVAQLRGIRT